MITDALAHPPPTDGAFSYDRYRGPGIVGRAYVDPVFGSTITRLTSEHPAASESDIYSKNGFWNADGTRMVHNTPAGLTIIDATTGAVIRDDVPGNFDGSFDPVDPNAWYFFEGANLMKYTIVAEGAVTSLVKTFTGKLGKLGGSVDWVSRDGRYMVLHIGASVRVWDKQNDVLYAGSLSGAVGSGWAGISPDGKYVVTTVGGKKSYAIDHDARTVSTKGVLFWTLCGDHGDLVSASDGHNYFITKDCADFPGVWRVDITKPQTASNADKQRAENKKLVATDWPDNDGHISCAGDWTYISTESTDDPHGGGVTNWRQYKQEILRTNVVTGSVERLAHHRSRGLGGEGNYRWQPRVCASWDGTRVAWASNMGARGSSDIYAIDLRAPGPVVPPVVPPSPNVTHTIELIVDGASRLKMTI